MTRAVGKAQAGVAYQTVVPDPVNEQVWPPAPKPLASRCSQPLKGKGRVFDVGPGHPISELTDVPWLSLKAGDVVNIFYRESPYRTKIALRAQGTPSAPIIINGVTNAKCELPEISGDGAVIAKDAIRQEFFEPKWKTDTLGLIFMHRLPFDGWGHRARHITFQNLKISGASRRNTFVAENGKMRRYHEGAAGIYAVVADHITIQNCEITGNGTGIFFNTKSKEETSSHVVVRNNRIYGNGNSGSWYEHNLYIQVRRALYEGNYIGQLVQGAKGSSLKDRSSGTVVRFNHIDAAARALDLVEIEGGYITNDPLYPHAWVYGNLIVSDHTRPALSSALLIHWGGDNDPRYFRGGTLFFYHNTVLTVADKSHHYYLSLFQPSDAKHNVDVRSNVLLHTGNAEQYLGYDAGTIDLQRTNWISPGWIKGKSGVRLLKSGKVLEGSAPVLDDNHRPVRGSNLIDKGSGGAPEAVDGVAMSNLNVDHEYSATYGMIRRPIVQDPDLGAFESR